MLNLTHEIFISYFDVFFNMPENLVTFGRRLNFTPEGRRSADSYRL
jgi:hypothetical protein